ASAVAPSIHREALRAGEPSAESPLMICAPGVATELPAGYQVGVLLGAQNDRPPCLTAGQRRHGTLTADDLVRDRVPELVASNVDGHRLCSAPSLSRFAL